MARYISPEYDLDRELELQLIQARWHPSPVAEADNDDWSGVYGHCAAPRAEDARRLPPDDDDWGYGDAQAC
ncbi:MAG: hypothetical protein ACR2M0_13770 [Chloroflexia bacterium]